MHSHRIIIRDFEDRNKWSNVVEVFKSPVWIIKLQKKNIFFIKKSIEMILFSSYLHCIFDY